MVVSTSAVNCLQRLVSEVTEWDIIPCPLTHSLLWQAASIILHCVSYKNAPTLVKLWWPLFSVGMDKIYYISILTEIMSMFNFYASVHVILTQHQWLNDVNVFISVRNAFACRCQDTCRLYHIFSILAATYSSSSLCLETVINCPALCLFHSYKVLIKTFLLYGAIVYKQSDV